MLLDLRLAVRMLARYPLLTIVSTLGMAFGLAAGVIGFEVRSQLTNPHLPLDGGQRIVGIRNWDASGDRAVRLGDADYRMWREQLSRVESLAAAALVDRNLAVGGNSEPVRVAEMTASGFGLARVSPVLGRPIIESDEAPGATPVAVIGHSLWQRRFQSDPHVVGRVARLGGEVGAVAPAHGGRGVGGASASGLRPPRRRRVARQRAGRAGRDRPAASGGRSVDVPIRPP